MGSSCKCMFQWMKPHSLIVYFILVEYVDIILRLTFASTCWVQLNLCKQWNFSCKCWLWLFCNHKTMFFFYVLVIYRAFKTNVSHQIDTNHHVTMMSNLHLLTYLLTLIWHWLNVLVNNLLNFFWVKVWLDDIARKITFSFY
jgi:hypothetical protein